MKITQDIIEKVNKNEKCPYGQGIFLQPSGIPDGINELVVYSRYETGGVKGGSCWDNSNPQPYTEECPKDHMAILDILLTEVMPSIGFSQYKRIQTLIESNEDSSWEYYGNHTDYLIEYILLSELEKVLTEWEDNA